jgi:hypothetical protein
MIRLSFEVPFSLEGQGPVFISSQGQGGPIIPPDTGFLFRRPLRLAGLR